MVKKRQFDRDFQTLAVNITHAIKANEGLVGDQRAQVEKLVELERKFRIDISKYNKATEVYQLFIDKFGSDGLNILSAQSYFRSKSIEFNKNISLAIKEKKPHDLMQHDINYLFIKFIVDNWDGELPVRSKKYYDELIEVRRILIENNLPLAINRAKIFYKKTAKSHLGLIDLIDICVYGLITGVDKYTGNYTPVWRAVSIGRMVGFMIEEYSKSFIRMYPSDKKILYRANALKHRLNIDNITELAEAVNESFAKDAKEGRAAPKLPITEVQIVTLMNSSNYISSDETTKDGVDDEDGGSIYDYTSDPESIEDKVEKNDAMNQMLSAAKKIDIIERKIIKLKGVVL